MLPSAVIARTKDQANVTTANASPGMEPPTDRLAQVIVGFKHELQPLLHPVFHVAIDAPIVTSAPFICCYCN